MSSKPPKEIYTANKTDIYYVDDVWSLDILDLKDYGPEDNISYKYVLVVIDNFSKLKNAQLKKDSWNYSYDSKKKSTQLKHMMEKNLLTKFSLTC